MPAHAKRRKSALKTLLSCLAIFAALQVLFTGMATLAAALPREAIEENLAESADDPLLNGYFDYSGSLMGSRECHDNNRYIASIARQDALSGPLEAAAINGIDDFDHTGAEQHWNYFRYWHGWSLLTNACLEIGGVRLVSLAVAAIELLALALLAREVRRELGTLSAALLAAALALSTGLFWSFLSDITLGISFAALCASLAGVVRMRGRPAEAALIAGCIYNFFDFCTVPALAVAMCSFCAALPRRGAGVRAVLAAGAIGAAAFSVGYIGTWLSKWALAACYLGVGEVVANVGGETQMWASSGFSTFEGHKYWPIIKAIPHLYPIAASLAVAVATPAGAAFAIASIGTLAFTFAKLGARETLRALAPCAGCLVIPLFCMAANVHAIEHTSIFTFRLWAAPAACMLASCAGARWPRQPTNKTEGEDPRDPAGDVQSPSQSRDRFAEEAGSRRTRECAVQHQGGEPQLKPVHAIEYHSKTDSTSSATKNATFHTVNVSR